MSENLKILEDERKMLYQELRSFGDFRPGTISVTYGKCGKKNCACAKKGHPGHGPRYLWSTTRKGKSIAEHLRLGPELDQVQKQVERGRNFQEWCQKVIETNEKICRLRPVVEIEDEGELAALKKKLQRKFLKKSKRRSKN